MSQLKFSDKPSIARKPQTPKQMQQWKLFVALGCVTGINGYLTNLYANVKATNIDNMRKHILYYTIAGLTDELARVETELRNEMQKLKEAPKK